MVLVHAWRFQSVRMGQVRVVERVMANTHRHTWEQIKDHCREKKVSVGLQSITNNRKTAVIDTHNTLTDTSTHTMTSNTYTLTGKYRDKGVRYVSCLDVSKHNIFTDKNTYFFQYKHIYMFDWSFSYLLMMRIIGYLYLSLF